jgi:predicted nucleic acid-binding protein
MIAADTSSMVAFFEGETGRDVDAIELALQGSMLFLPPAVLCELLSDPGIPENVRQTILGFPLLEIKPNFWERAGDLRKAVLTKKLTARLGDALIAQSCLDAGIPLVTRDHDFRNLGLVSKLKIISDE